MPLKRNGMCIVGKLIQIPFSVDWFISYGMRMHIFLSVHCQTPLVQYKCKTLFAECITWNTLTRKQRRTAHARILNRINFRVFICKDVDGFDFPCAEKSHKCARKQRKKINCCSYMAIPHVGNSTGLLLITHCFQKLLLAFPYLVPLKAQRHH